MEYVILILYFSFFVCLCALVCLYFSGCQEMTYKHEGKSSSLLVPINKLHGLFFSPFVGQWNVKKR
ncbi:uncharacterized protein LOC143819657 [Paroedura picta]|uniref:uncharacterized protein LOC143819657 n=1 Tax=Paroedura picta TaxID=143630 RepID=UPI0040577994